MYVSGRVEWLVITSIIVISPAVPEAVPHCSTTAVYNGSSDELTDIVVNWHQAEVSHECLVISFLLDF